MSPNWISTGFRQLLIRARDRRRTLLQLVKPRLPYPDQHTRELPQLRLHPRQILVDGVEDLSTENIEFSMQPTICNFLKKICQVRVSGAVLPL
jgi:hypothetical protein